MSDEDDLPRPGDPLVEAVKTDLDRLSVHELEARVRLLDAELARTKARLKGAEAFRSGADSLFKK